MKRIRTGLVALALALTMVAAHPAPAAAAMPRFFCIEGAFLLITEQSGEPIVLIAPFRGRCAPVFAP